LARGLARGAYELGVTGYEAEDAWVARYVDVCLAGNAALRQTLARLAPRASQVVGAKVAETLAGQVVRAGSVRGRGGLTDARGAGQEGQVRGLKFTALGALKFDNDVRALMQSAVNCTSPAARAGFRRLRHMVFLLNLSSAREAGEMDFPAPALDAGEVEQVLAMRAEREFFA
jgi:hypothetical protein